MIEGVLLKGYGGFYYVRAEDRVWECSLRGRFRVRDQDFFPGDRVAILPGRKGATIEKVEPRRNVLVRPSVANVDQALLVFAMTSPRPDLNLLDRLLIQVSGAGIKPFLILTKFDLWTPAREEEAVWQGYERLGYLLARISNKTGEGLEKVRPVLRGRISVLAGPSGAGKSSLTNLLVPGMELKTGDVSRKLKRGRHTTRHVELFECEGGLVADTPGFSSLDLPAMKREELVDFFPEMDPYRGLCRFKSCLHDQEPECAVKRAVARGEILPQRYEHYRQFLQEVIAAERRY
ncbi:putative ribosome biogenesis GTPase RsgA [Peptococcaceae bacterium CEB3]|nr:putative ribosome biogenesis GTPase RsgA [Peptococcaceae bacterium CEB3]